MDLVKKLLQGDEKSAARLISLIEEGRPEGFRAISLIYPAIGKAHKIGITGAPGAGKSTLIGKLAAGFADDGKKIGIIAVDPTSARSGGALLGDRVRMRDADKTGEIFIRSMASRGYSGGIAKAAIGAAYILEGLGKDTIIVESVGVGQTEIQISALCDTVVTVVTSDYGDDIQLMKAGVIEIGDIVAVNKADKSDAEDTVRDISIHIGNHKQNNWKIPVVAVQSISGQGIAELKNHLYTHFVYLSKDESGILKKKERLKKMMLSLLKEEAWNILIEKWGSDDGFKDIIERLQDGGIDPYAAVKRASDMMFNNTASAEMKLAD
jgi:LAO/AO transport system kinase